MAHDTIQSPLILEIKGNSLDDGPGIRSVIFFKGCPLSCIWCHNPESKKAVMEIAFDARKCIDCGSCRKVCNHNALSRENPFYIHRTQCTLCFNCVGICPSGALDKVGRKMSIDDILGKILPDKPFFDSSSGGVTLSGGEPTLFMKFTAELLNALKHHHIHTLIETSGYFDLERFMDILYPHLDTIYFDLKIMDSHDHKKYCGVPNEKILDNLMQLAAFCHHDGKKLLPRTPLIPRITDTEKNLHQIASFLKDIKITEAVLLEYNPLWHEKSFKIGVPYPFKDDKIMNSFTDKSILEQCRNFFLQQGIMV
jgi:pyruvate formate lyase activating enzyme